MKAIESREEPGVFTHQKQLVKNLIPNETANHSTNDSENFWLLFYILVQPTKKSMGSDRRWKGPIKPEQLSIFISSISITTVNAYIQIP